MKPSGKNCKRIVVKIGSSLFYGADKRVDFVLLERLCSDIDFLFKSGQEVVIVTSGAIALGMEALRLKTRPKELAALQAAAAIGQNDLMDVYRGIFRKKGLQCGQVLLTWDDFDNRTRYLIARNTLGKLLTLGVVPIINENDAVSIDEIRFGDNDQLSALVANIVGADLLIILSDVDGLWGSDKKTIVRLVTEINDEITGLAATTTRTTSVGGMITKIKAAEKTTRAGIPCVIANGRAQKIIRTLAQDPGACGTLFVPKQAALNHKQRWLAYSTKPKGKIMVDDGAKKALLNKKSLLSVGVYACSGKFKAGDVVEILNNDKVFARGKINFGFNELDIGPGSRLRREVVHCDNIVIF
ncbi:MAG TPA: glutamate 5-kinase [Candidatus Omnitrophota bacterium]|nr:glutamate 5-kinase [Candidatus Omnitrophota bacterium]HQO38318.1 glutamate 5-kinase [Candidatus Omnitrophota bacterium]HQQ06658.1 glutamate 5-kinase [Candidatus Omnitrophota bacterium]